ncbi:hypothetical protein [Acinetobacter sp. WZC-1]|uniref:hypothetical protein n=1 Tax=Acinetobacter sp. WZC-1 TaxID=3459034 RepID=UPI00403E21AE
MALHILKKKLDESHSCPLCQAAMYFIEAEEFEQELNYHECSHCQHKLFQNDQHNCHCKHCTETRKKLLTETRLQEQRKLSKNKQTTEYRLEQLSFLNKLFLLSLLDSHIQEGVTHDEFIEWDAVKYQPITPSYFFQNQLVKQLVRDGILLARDFSDHVQRYYLNVRLDGYSEPSLFSITQQLRHWFYENLSRGLPFQQAEEVRDALYTVLYQEIIQFMQHYCRTWGIQIAGNQSFQTFCHRLLDSLALGQIYYLVQTALEYLYQQKALQTRNENFINTHLLKKTLQQYRERSVNEKWETATLPRPQNIPLSKMSEILFFRLLGYDETIFFQPVWRSWKKIEPRLNFYAAKRCMHCGSDDLNIEYDAENHVTLSCRHCGHQDHYFTR